MTDHSVDAIHEQRIRTTTHESECEERTKNHEGLIFASPTSIIFQGHTTHRI